MATPMTKAITPLLLAILFLLAPWAESKYVQYARDSIGTGQCLVQGIYRFCMQYDCNLVLYDGATAVWATGTQGKGVNCFARLESNGELVVYDGFRNRVWGSNSAGKIDNYKLILQTDRNVVIYDGSGNPTWATNTQVP